VQPGDVAVGDRQGALGIADPATIGAGEAQRALSQGALGHKRPNGGGGGREDLDVLDMKPAALGLGEGEEPLGLGGAPGQGELADDVATCAERGAHLGGVHVVGGADRHGVYGVEQGLEAGKSPGGRLGRRASPRADPLAAGIRDDGGRPGASGASEAYDSPTKGHPIRHGGG
jgi:hypothetical protein